MLVKNKFPSITHSTELCPLMLSHIFIHIIHCKPMFLNLLGILCLLCPLDLNWLCVNIYVCTCEWEKKKKENSTNSVCNWLNRTFFALVLLLLHTFLRFSEFKKNVHKKSGKRDDTNGKRFKKLLIILVSHTMNNQLTQRTRSHVKRAIKICHWLIVKIADCWTANANCLMSLSL